MRIEAYLDRIGVEGPLDPILDTLQRVQRAHLFAIPYENLDVQFRRTVTPDVPSAYDKIVTRGRGGWCYEMNGLMGWALGELGFSVTRLCGGNHLTPDQSLVLGNHLLLRVDLDEPWIVDVGFGDGPIAPYRLAEGPIHDGRFDYELVRLPDGRWRFNNHSLGMSPYFEFDGAAPNEAALATRCVWLQTHADSPFVPNAVHLRHTPEGQVNLIGRRLRTLDSNGKSTRLIGDADEYLATLRDVFGLDLPEAASLWPRICVRHEEIERMKQAATTSNTKPKVK